MRKAVKVILSTLAGLLLLLLGATIWLQTDTGQDWLTRQVVGFVRQKLPTRFEIAQVRFQWPDWIELRGLYVEDLQRDTLLSGKRLRVEMDLWGLTQNRVAIRKIALDDVHLHVRRDTVFNFDFLTRAFSSPDAAPDTTATALEMRLDALLAKGLHLRYQDAQTGTDADLHIADATLRFAAFDPAQNRYHLTSSTLASAHTKVRLYAPTYPTAPSLPAASAPNDTLDIRLGKIHLRDYAFQYHDERSGTISNVKIGQLKLESGPLSLVKMEAIFPQIDLQNGDLQVQSGDFHLRLTHLNTLLEDFHFSPQNTTGQLRHANFVEQRGFVLRQFKTNFRYTPQQIALRELRLQTNETLLQNQAVLTFESLEKLPQNIGNLGLDLRLKGSRLGFKDVLTWVPSLKNAAPFGKNPTATLRLDGDVKGKVNDLLLTGVEVGILTQTHLRLDGRVRGLPDMSQTRFDLNLKELSSSQRDLTQLLPPKTLPDSLTIPSVFTLAGQATGTLDNLRLNARLSSDLGGATWTGTLQNFVKGQQQTYNGELRLVDFDAGKFLQKSPQQLGKISLDLTLQGQGIDPKTLETRWQGHIRQADLNGYSYQNLTTTGSIAQQQLAIDALLQDPHANLQLHAKADLSGAFPTVEADADLQKLSLQPLGLYADSMDIKGKIKVNFTSTDPANPLGSLRVTDGLLLHRGRPIPLEKLWIQLQNRDNERFASVESPFLTATVRGVFDYAHLADVLLHEAGRYFALSGVARPALTPPHRFTVQGQVVQHPFLAAFVPALTRLDTTRFSLVLNSQSDTTLLARVSSPLLTYDSSSVKNADFGIVGIENEARYVGHIDQIETNGYNLKRVYFDGGIANNALQFNVALKDTLFRQKHGIAGTLTAESDQYRLQFRDKGLLLDYKLWQSDSVGYVQFGNKGLRIQDFALRQNDQKLTVSSIDSTYNGPLKIAMQQLDLKALAKLAPDSSLAIAGTLGGDILLQNYAQSPVFTGNLAIQQLAYTGIPIGDIALKATNKNQNTLTAEATLKSQDNDLIMSGNYLLNNPNPLDFQVNINKLSAKTVEAFSMRQLRQARGALTGKLSVKGAVTQPRIEGMAQFDSVAFNLAMLGAVYRIHNSQLHFAGSDIFLRRFVVNDTLGQPLQIDGKLNIAQLPNVAYDLSVQGRDFRMLNASRKDNDFFYGQGIVDANVHVAGVGAQSAVDGTVKLKQGSDITVILPDDQAGQAATEGVVEFVTVRNDGEQNKENVEKGVGEDKAIKTAGGMEISLNLEADDKSQLTIVVDERNGDNLKVRGNAQLNAGITPNGQPFILGLYELSQGSYDLTFEVLKRAFTIQKGSRLIWSGDPMKADVNITAVYPVTTELTALKESAKVYGKMPLDVLLKMEGSLDNPTITFDIRLNESVPNDVKSKIANDGIFASIKDNTALMNKQVFSL
ncbi:MAG: translocation/assembly module TamB, partial [Spirosomaceae bacterium]|nr:translocation/assembly module TamB [Spirosomataceae bacterium]